MNVVTIYDLADVLLGKMGSLRCGDTVWGWLLADSEIEELLSCNWKWRVLWVSTWCTTVGAHVPNLEASALLPELLLGSDLVHDAVALFFADLWICWHV
ncbi:hypothetical protein Nepgr_012458 [Nepenthes gracilis]|uniref:Uncharacterized protein n=1 Tax=Nepenthes gracilis TaxID=150966 RepID=A0AAD3XMT7_NEPGR|nr:hypothetical protein Nepgr_012458 [Nepenthes gracilis]